MRPTLLALALLALSAQGVTDRDSKVLITFPGPIWVENNDPVMGGQSHGNWSVVDKSYGHFQGSVKNVSFLHAPGFCRAMTISPLLRDASELIDGGLEMTARTSTPTYKGFKLSFGTIGAPRHHGGHEIQGSFKANFNIPASQNGEWQTITLKFSEFSADWSDYTGDCSTKDPDGYQHQCCTKDTPSVCPSKGLLKHINSFNIWAEGVEGDFDMELKQIAATPMPGSDSVIAI